MMTDQDRERAVNLFTQGFSYSFIANEYGVHTSTISRLCKKFTENGSIARLPGSGRKRITTEKQDMMIVRQVKQDNKTPAYRIKAELDLQNVSTRTVRRRITESGEFESGWAEPVPFISDKNRKYRKTWCYEHRHWTKEQWRKVLWSDESPFELRCRRRFMVWRRPEERYHPKNCKGTVKHDKKIQVWGCFAAHGVGNLYRVPGILDQHGYHSILQWQMKPSVQRLFPTKDCIFQQDNDPKHTARSIRTYLENYEVPTLPWPSQSPDLNPIENLWSILDLKVKDRKPSNEDALFEVLKEAWQNLEPELLTKLADSMPERIEAVIAANGYPTKY